MTASKHPLHLEALPSAHDGEDLAGAIAVFGGRPEVFAASIPLDRTSV
jgi:hypothetical protein